MILGTKHIYIYIFLCDYRLTLAMGFIVINSPQILIRSQKCGRRIGVDGKVSGFLVFFQILRFDCELVILTFNDIESICSFQPFQLFWIFRFLPFGGAVPYRPVEDLAFSVARFYQRGGTFQNYYMVLYVSLSYDFSSS